MTGKHKDKTQDKAYYKSHHRIKHKATQIKSNTGTTALERSVVYLPESLKHYFPVG